MNIKVCGISSMKQLQQLDGLDIDFAGFHFYRHSPNYMVGKLQKNELAGADLDIKKVGVFVNADYDEIMQSAEDYGLDIIQLHGDETPHLCEQVSNELETIKTFRIDHKSETLIDYILKDYDEVCDYYLFDTDNKPAVAGKTLHDNWRQIADSSIEKPFFFSGGIGPDDAKAVKSFSHPDYYGVDINGLFDKEPGLKDMGLILKFIQNLK